MFSQPRGPACRRFYSPASARDARSGSNSLFRAQTFRKMRTFREGLCGILARFCHAPPSPSLRTLKPTELLRKSY